LVVARTLCSHTATGYTHPTESTSPYRYTNDSLFKYN